MDERHRLAHLAGKALDLRRYQCRASDVVVVRRLLAFLDQGGPLLLAGTQPLSVEALGSISSGTGGWADDEFRPGDSAGELQHMKGASGVPEQLGDQREAAIVPKVE